MRRYGWTTLIIAVIVIFAFGGKVLQLYTDWLWYKNLGYSVIFSKSIVTSTLLGLIFGILFFILIYSNLWIARRLAPPPPIRFGERIRMGERLGQIARSTLGVLLFLGSLVLSVLVGFEAATHWDDYLRYANSVPFGTLDPLFHKDIGFYVFQLPFIRYIYAWLFFALIVATIATSALHYADEAVEFLANRPQFAPKVKTHISILLASLLFLRAWGYYLDRYSLLYKANSVVFGAGYTDVHVRLATLVILFWAAIIAGLLVLLNIRRRGIGLAIVAFVGLIAVSLIVGAIVPGIIQSTVVKPNEFAKEQKFITWGIAGTRAAYNLNRIRTDEYPVKPTISSAQLAQNRTTIENIRLWDYKQLLDAYAQLQEIQQYYKFNDADVDRYNVNGRTRQVMLSARELDKGSLPENAQTWVNSRLQYTHGYGAVMSPVNEATSEGMPVLYIENIPSVSNINVDVTNPDIYFGELTDDYVIVRTSAKEFDYPSADRNVFTTYKGGTGVPIGGYLRRLLFALRFSDVNLMLNQNINKNSLILYNRDITQRARTLFPFLQFDSDPYLVVSDGKLYWFHDAYTSTDRYPYSKPVDAGGINYIRNGAKVITDAYTGAVTAYISDPTDPVIKAYAKMFPGTLKPMSAMPAGLRAHIRYPQDLFEIQSSMFTTYHMTDPQQFYTKGDQWALPKQPQGVDPSEGEYIEPYYLLTTLPGETNETFLLLNSMIRANKKNMVAWMAARSDPDRYGEMVVYEFPKGQQFFGPEQIAGRANQNTQISSELTLWNQQGSAVSRGTMLVIPVAGSILYVEPIYLESTSTKIPELKRVIAAIGSQESSQLAMAPSLQEALAQVAGVPPEAVPSGIPETAQAGTAPTGAAPAPTGPTPTPEIRNLINQARQQFNQAQQAQRQGDWAGYGKSLDNLNKTLNQLEQRTGR